MITLYSTNCPKCRVLEMKLKQKGIKFEIEIDINKMISLGIQSAPVLAIDGKLYDFSQSLDYLNRL